jgi:hypothetical protein
VRQAPAGNSDRQRSADPAARGARCWCAIAGLVGGLLVCPALRAETFVRVPLAARADEGLLRDLAGWAARLAQRAPPASDATLPLWLPMHPLALAQTVCPQRPAACRGLVAAYDTERSRILYRDTLDLRDPSDQSFLVHELVHWLQHRDRALADEPDCPSVLAAEHEAYAVQNRYLGHFRQWLRVGQVLHYTVCPPAGNGVAGSTGTAAEPVVRFDAATGLISSPRPMAASAADLAGLPGAASAPAGPAHSFQSTTPK